MKIARPFRLALAGQSLIERPLHEAPSAGSQRIRELISNSDLAITNLEVAIETPGGWPVRDTTTHSADETVLDTLAWFGFRGVALASNHAFDLGPAGIVAALDATKRRQMITAGTGCDAATAAAPGIAAIGDTTVALHAVVAAQNPVGAHALDATAASRERPGINRLRVDELISLDSAQVSVLQQIDIARASASDVGEPRNSLVTAKISDFTSCSDRAWRAPDAADVATLLRSVRASAREADIVIVYLHNHYWANPPESTPSWVSGLARRCIDDGASVVFGHGTPAMQGIEFYRGHLIAYGLGSFVFHTRKPARYDTTAWESVLIDADLDGAGLVEEVRLHPLIHGRHPARDPRDGHDGSPAIAETVTGQGILARLDQLSAPFGTKIAIASDGIARAESVTSAQ